MSFALPVDLGWISLVLVVAAVTLGYLVFGATGFGTSIMLADYAIGSHLHAKLSGPTIRTWIAWLLLVNGALLALRAMRIVDERSG